MKRNVAYKQMIAVLVFVSITACNNDDKNRVEKDGTINYISTGISTKAVDTNWELGDAIGLFLYNEDTTAIIDNQFNYQYVNTVAGPTGVFEPASSSQTLYFPQNGDNIVLKGYYPYRSGLTTNMVYSVDVSNQAILQNIDLMTAEHQTGFSKTDPNVLLHFYHRMVKLVFVMEPEDEDNDVINYQGMTLTIQGMYQGNSYDISADDFLVQYTQIDDITVPYRTGEEVEERTAIVLPRAAGDGVVFLFTAQNGDTYMANMSPTLELEGGNQYTFIITLSKNPITVNATIEAWVDNAPERYPAN